MDWIFQNLPFVLFVGFFVLMTIGTIACYFWPESSKKPKQFSEKGETVASYEVGEGDYISVKITIYKPHGFHQIPEDVWRILHVKKVKEIVFAGEFEKTFLFTGDMYLPSGEYDPYSPTVRGRKGFYFQKRFLVE